MSFIKKLFTRRKRDRSEGDDLAEQAELAENLRDMLSVARKYNFPVILTVECNSLRHGIIFRAAGDDVVWEWLFNYSAGRALSLNTEAQEWANLNGRPAGRWKPRGRGRGA